MWEADSLHCLTFSSEDTPDIGDIPALAAAVFRNAIADRINGGWRLLALFGAPTVNNDAELFAVLADGGRSLCAIRSLPLKEFDSIARECPQAQLFEREIYESLGIMPRHHPWLKAVRVTPDARGKSMDADYGFFRIQGNQTHEVGVGPIHAGVIEPGHFRFQCYGENVLNLEIALGYQHRGIEERLVKLPAAASANHLRLRLVECIAGDASVAHATAQCVLWEKMLLLPQLSPQIQRIRRIGLELERLACHCGDLGALAGDTGFLPTSSWNGRIRGDFLNLTAAVCGNRFGREYVCLGGVCSHISAEECEEMGRKLASIGRDAIGSCNVMFSSASVRDRMEGTGALTRDQAWELGLVGVAARACGLKDDARFQFPLSPLPLYGTEPRVEQNGDVLARAKVRFMELRDSLVIVKKDLEWLAENQADSGNEKLPDMRLPADKLGVSLVESWRGEVCHIGLTGQDGNFRACKFIDPSFHNWAGLAIAMRNGQISDFPLCNKSFNLSYCGHDL